MKLRKILLCSVLITSFFLLKDCKTLLDNEKKQSTQQDISQGPTLSITAVGDIMCHDRQLISAFDYECQCYDFSSTFRKVTPYLSRADISIGNLETTLPGDDTKKPYSGYPQFGSPDSLAQAIKDSGIDVLSLANNHSVDKGLTGILRTLDVTQSLGFFTLGTYRSKEEWKKKRVLILRKKGFRIALLNYSYGTNGLKVPRPAIVNMIDDKKIIADLHYVHDIVKPDLVIVIYHFGKEYKRYPDAFQKKYVNLAFKHGADVILGGHPHVLQPYELQTVKDVFNKKKKRLVIYSLGNFVSSQQRHYTDGGIMFHFEIRKNSNPQAEQNIIYSKVSHTLVWVYVEKFKKNKVDKEKFHILPIRNYLKKKNQVPSLRPSARKKMLLFYNESKALLENKPTER